MRNAGAVLVVAVCVIIGFIILATLFGPVVTEMLDTVTAMAAL